jgi:hypothetical protein
VRVEEIGDEGKVQFRVAGDEGGGSQEFAAFEFVGVVEDLFGALEQVPGLEWCARAEFWLELVEEDGIIFAIFDIIGEVLYSCAKLVDILLEKRAPVPSIPVGILQVIVEPS